MGISRAKYFRFVTFGTIIMAVMFLSKSNTGNPEPVALQRHSNVDSGVAPLVHQDVPEAVLPPELSGPLEKRQSGSSSPQACHNYNQLFDQCSFASQATFCSAKTCASFGCESGYLKYTKGPNDDFVAANQRCQAAYDTLCPYDDDGSNTQYGPCCEAAYTFFGGDNDWKSEISQVAVDCISSGKGSCLQGEYTCEECCAGDPGAVCSGYVPPSSPHCLLY